MKDRLLFPLWQHVDTEPGLAQPWAGPCATTTKRVRGPQPVWGRHAKSSAMLTEEQRYTPTEVKGLNGKQSTCPWRKDHGFSHGKRQLFPKVQVWLNLLKYWHNQKMQLNSWKTTQFGWNFSKGSNRRNFSSCERKKKHCSVDISVIKSQGYQLQL